MNQKTAKLLQRVARHHQPQAYSALYKQLKAEWDRLTAEQRRKRRAVYRALVTKGA
jgi:hypothetical protein